MHNEHRTNIGCSIRTTATLRLESNISMDDAHRQLESLGNEVIERNDADRTFKVLDAVNNPTEDVWVCDYCDAYSHSRQTILDHEATEHGSKDS